MKKVNDVNNFFSSERDLIKTLFQKLGLNLGKYLIITN